MRLVRTGLLLAMICQGLYWLGVVLERGEEPLSLLGMVLARGYMMPLMALTALGLLLALWGGISEARRRRTPG
jgi:NADH:ubiquinone oxidoreductase subunit 6 (subunit J)